jgi:hypothetical protein
MKYPTDLSNSTRLSHPKPDYLLGATLDVVDDLFTKCGVGLGENPAKFNSMKSRDSSAASHTNFVFLCLYWTASPCQEAHCFHVNIS